MKLFIHKYKQSKEALRKSARKLAKEGKITLLEKTKDGFLYDISGYEVRTNTYNNQKLIKL